MSGTLYLIGNGFDLHHNLPTSYGDYKAYLQDKDPDLVKEIDGLLYMNGAFGEEIELWSKLEEYTGIFAELDFDSLYEQAFDASEPDMDRASYWDDPKYFADDYGEQWVVFFNNFKSYFKKWIDSITINEELKDTCLAFDADAAFLNFNYTKSLETLYGISSENILYIHSNNGDYILGHNQPENIPYHNPDGRYTDENGNETFDDFRHTGVRNSFNSTYQKIYNTFSKNSQKLINKYSYWFSKIPTFDRIIVMGLSLGKEDEPYINYISKNADNCNKLVFYCHNDSDQKRAKEIAQKFKDTQISYVNW